MRGRRQRSWRGPRRKPKVAWVRDLFDNNVIDGSVTRAPDALSLFEYNDLWPTTTTVAAPSIVKRVVVDGAFVATPLANGTATIALRWVLRAALVVVDVDDINDGDMLSAAQGELLQAHRILHVTTFGGIVTTPSAFASTDVPHGWSAEHLHIDWTGGAKVQPDQNVWLYIQRIAPAGSVENNFVLDYSLNSSVLVQRS